VKTRALAVFIALLLVAAPLGYVGYGYFMYSKVVNPGEPITSTEYVVIKTPAGQFYSMTSSEFREYVSEGGKLPAGSKLYRIRVESYLTGSPVVDLNTTLRSIYDSYTIVLGAPSLKNCKTNPNLYPGSCSLRTATVMELTAFVSNIFSTIYYLKALAMGYDNATARAYAYNQTLLRNRKVYLTFWTKFRIGSGRLGNSHNLALVLIGPAEGATANRVFVPRKGLVVFEGTSDDTLRAEVVLVEHLIGFQWPEGKNPQIVSATG